MHYPYEMPADLRRRVESARDLAEMALRERLKSPNPHRLNAAYEYIRHVFGEFAEQCNEVERSGMWTGSEGREQVERFLERDLIPEAYELAGARSFTPDVLRWSPLSLEAFTTEVIKRVKTSEVWTVYLQRRAQLAMLRQSDGQRQGVAATEATVPAPAGQSAADQASEGDRDGHEPPFCQAADARSTEPVELNADQYKEALREHRWGLVDEFKQQRGIKTWKAFTTATGIGEDSVGGIVRDEPRKSTPGARANLLRTIGVSGAVWDTPPSVVKASSASPQ
jgi:hypothetical protein